MNSARNPEPSGGTHSATAGDPARHGSGESAAHTPRAGDANPGRATDSPPVGPPFSTQPSPADTPEEAVGDPDIVEQVRRAQEGSAQAFALLYDHYVDQVFAFVYHRVGHRQTAEDLVGDVFLRALRRIDTFTWQGVDFAAWLITIARNRVNDHFKSARFRLEAPVEEVFDTGASVQPNDPEDAAMSNEVAAHIHEALENMKDEQAEVLYLRFIQHLNVAETGAVLGKSEGAVKALQYRALKSLARLVPTELTE